MSPTIDKRKEAEAKLPPELHETFNDLIKDYEAACEAHVKGRRVFRNYNILVDLVRAGWRKVRRNNSN